MVGVPGRSKACSTCRKRKLGRPSCGQCLKSELPCGGYARTPIFINSSQNHRDATTLSFIPAAYTPPSSIEVNHSSLSSTRHDKKDARPTKRKQQHQQKQKHQQVVKDVVLAPPLPSCSTDSPLQRITFETFYIDAFWAALLPNGEPFSAEAGRYSTASWTTVVRDQSQQGGRLVRMALLANALSAVGSSTGQPALVMGGWTAYTQAMVSLARELRRGVGSGTTAEVVSTSLLLAHYEAMQTPESLPSPTPVLTWFRHATGCRAIILSQRPEAFVEGQAHSIFVDSRLPLIYMDLTRRTACPINTPEWRRIPWAVIPKTPKDEMVDILLHVPALLGDLEELMLESGESFQKDQLRQKMERKCRELDEELQAWKRTSGSETTSFAESCLVPSTWSQITSLSVEQFAMAHLALIYWTTCNLVYHTLWFLLKHKDEAFIPERVFPRQYCRRVALLVSLIQSRQVGMFFFNMAALPVAVTVGFLAREDPRGLPSEEFQLLLKCLESGRHGRHVKSFLGAWPWRMDREQRMMKFSVESAG